MSHVRMLYARPDGTLLEHPVLRPAAASFSGPTTMHSWLPLPRGATLCQLPGCEALGYDSRGRLKRSDHDGSLAVGALMPTGYARLAIPAYAKAPGAPFLPLFGYTAVASVDGVPCAAYAPIDAPGTWDPEVYNTANLRARVEARLACNPDDALLAQLGICALEYGCYTAQNIFYERWEGALPASPTCSAQCVGCISEQLGDVPSPQIRLKVAPAAEQLARLALGHLRGGPDRMISFGQGCEGDPLNRWRALTRTVRLIREQLPAQHPCGGVINMNTNGWHTRGLQEVVNAGLQRIRVSIFSAVHEHYSAYYQPRGYSFADVRRSIRMCSDSGVWVAINLLTFPGYTDASGEIDALLELVATERVHEVQIRSLNIDREMLRESVPPPAGREQGVRRLIEALQGAHVRVATHAWMGSVPNIPAIRARIG